MKESKGEMLKAQISLRVDRQLAERLKRRAAREHRTLSSLCVALFHREVDADEAQKRGVA